MGIDKKVYWSLLIFQTASRIGPCIGDAVS